MLLLPFLDYISRFANYFENYASSAKNPVVCQLNSKFTCKSNENLDEY